MNVLLFFPFSLTFLFSFSPCHFPPSLQPEPHFHGSLSQNRVAPGILSAKNQSCVKGAWSRLLLALLLPCPNDANVRPANELEWCFSPCVALP